MMNIVACCCHSGQKKLGTELGPKLINDSLKHKYPHINSIIHHINENAFVEGIGYQMLYDKNRLIHENILSLGGDHSIGISTVMSSFYKYQDNLKVIWVDAHADINTDKTSPSQNKHGMPLAPVFNLMKSWVNFAGDQYYPKPEQLVYIGLRSVDGEEKEIIKKLGIKVYSNIDVKNEGIDKIMNEILGQDSKDTSYHLSFDIDGLDPKYASSTGTVEENGLTLDDGKTIVDRLIKTQNLKAYDLVEFNPKLGSPEDLEITLNTCIELIEPYFTQKN